MRKPHLLRVSLACFLLAALLLCLNIRQAFSQDVTLASAVGGDVTGISFYYRGHLRQIIDAPTLDAVNDWSLSEVDVSGWYGETGAPVSGYAILRVCLSLPPSCDDHTSFFANDTDEAMVYAFVWLGAWRSREHPDAIYAMTRADMEMLTAQFTEPPFPGLAGTPREQFYAALDALHASGSE